MDTRGQARSLTRRQMLLLIASAGAALAIPRHAQAETRLMKRRIPRTGEEIPAVGLGTWQSFDVQPQDGARWKTITEVFDRFFTLGGRVIDSSPMYGDAEAAIGTLLGQTGRSAKDAFMATKVWTEGQARGEKQMAASMRKMSTQRMDLMQIHNLLDWKTHMKTLRAWKEQGRIRYIGVTHYALDTFDEFERIMKSEPVDFIQIPYSITVRKAEKRILPVAADRGVAVLVMRPFEGGNLFSQVRGKALPAWASDIDCTSWAQVFLKYILGHPQVTCPIPATSKVKHLEDNMRAGLGRLPDERMRGRMRAFVDKL